MRPLIGYDPDFDYLYDPQQAKPLGKCPNCGFEIWSPDKLLCNRCAVYSAEREPDWEYEDE